MRRINAKIKLDANMDADDYGARLTELVNKLTDGINIIIQFGEDVTESIGKKLFNQLLDDLHELGKDNKIVAYTTCKADE